MTDEEFVQKIRQYNSVIHKACNVYYKRASRADLVQEIILELYRSLPNFKNSCTFKTWVYTIAKNTCITRSRNEKKHKFFECPEDYEEVFSVENSCNVTFEQLHNAMRYDVVMTKLKEPEKQIFQLYLEGMSYKELEKNTGINENHLRIMIHRLKKRLQLRYGRYKNY